MTLRVFSRNQPTQRVEVRVINGRRVLLRVVETTRPDKGDAA
jgi:hypothetical protein